jgi:hypothetical protein
MSIVLLVTAGIISGPSLVLFLDWLERRATAPREGATR